jgi:hypothetical protein
MKRLATCLIALTAATALDAAGFVNSAAAFPAYYLRFRTTKLPYSSCPTDAKNTVNTLGLANKVIDSFGAGGTTPSVRGYILCIRIPKAGPCGKDGATVVFNSASENDADAKSFLDKLDKTFGNAVLIDCN